MTESLPVCVDAVGAVWELDISCVDTASFTCPCTFKGLGPHSPARKRQALMESNLDGHRGLKVLAWMEERCVQPTRNELTGAKWQRVRPMIHEVLFGKQVTCIRPLKGLGREDRLPDSGEHGWILGGCGTGKARSER